MDYTFQPENNQSYTRDLVINEIREYSRGGRHLVISLNEGTLKVCGKYVCVDIITNTGRVKLLGSNIDCYIHKQGSAAITEVDPNAPSCRFHYGKRSPHFDKYQNKTFSNVLLLTSDEIICNPISNAPYSGQSQLLNSFQQPAQAAPFFVNTVEQAHVPQSFTLGNQNQESKTNSGFKNSKD